MRAPAAALLTLALAAAAPPPARAQAGETPTYTVTLRDGRIEPASLTVPVGVKIRLAVRNAGQGPAEFEHLGLRVEKVLAPGAASTLVLHPLRPGRYQFIDEFHPDGPGLTLEAR